MTANRNRAKFSGTCQLCGHFQKLPNDRLSLHGYEVRWNCFVGDCPGSRGLPFEKSIDLIEAAIARAKKVAAELRADAPVVRANRDPKGVEMTVYRMDARRVSDGAPMPQGRYDGSSFQTRGTLAKTASGFSFTFTRGDEYVVELGITKGYYPGDKLEPVVEKFRAREADALVSLAKSHEEYAAWQTKRIAGWVPHPEKLVPVDEADYAPTLHAVNEYWTKKSGRTTALCSSTRSSGYKQTTTDRSKVNCKACLKALVAADAAAIESTKANELVAEMVAKYGPTTTTAFSDANGRAIKELRYNRKELDKGVRKLATDRLERGIK